MTEKYFSIKEKEVTLYSSRYLHTLLRSRDYAWMEQKLNFMIKQQHTNTAKLNPHENLYPYGITTLNMVSLNSLVVVHGHKP